MKCLICGEKTEDLLVYIKTRRKRVVFWSIVLNETRNLCRNHLIEEFKEEFCSFLGKLIVFYPDCEEKTKPKNYTYEYVSLNDMRKRQKQEGYGAQIKFMENALQSIKGSCNRCNNIANTAYFGKGILKWKNYGRLIEWDTPLIEEVTVEPEKLCAKCCYQEMQSSLKNFKGDFSRLAVPYEEKGMYFPCLD